MNFGNGSVCNFGGASVLASRLVSSLAPPKLSHYLNYTSEFTPWPENGHL